MAQKTSVALRDDLTGGKAAATVYFALDGKAYEIDLNKRNAAALRKAIATRGHRHGPFGGQAC